jgi:hypothetical protein
MRTVKSGTIQGTRVGAGPAGETSSDGFSVAKIIMAYYCANGHRTTVPFIGTATPPPQWECRVCPEAAGTDPLDPPSRVASYADAKTHLRHVRSRRTQADGDRLMGESLARRDHPEESDVWTRPRGRKA